MEPRKAYFVNQAITDEQGNYIPCIAVEGESGYYKTTWTWGKDFNLAEQIANEKNQAMGLSLKEAYKIVFSSMR